MSSSSSTGGAIRHNTALNAQVSAATLTARSNISHSKRRLKQQPTRRRGTAASTTDMDLVAEEIETVIFGESDEEEEEGDSDDECDRDDSKGDATGSQKIRAAASSWDTRPRRSRKRRPDKSSGAAIPTDFSNINSYTLFDLPGDEGRKSRGHQQQRKGSVLSSSSAIIYAKKYQSPGALFIPILIFLCGTSVLLLVVEVLMNLVTAAVGIALLVLLVVKIVQEFITRPIRLIRTVHSSPICCMAALGATLGTLHALWEQHVLPLILSCIHESGIFASGSVGDWMQIVADAMRLQTISDTESTPLDRIIMWGLLKGLIIGIEVGSIWLILLGDTTNPTALSRYIYRHVWRPLKRQYRESVMLKRQHERWSEGELKSRWENEKVANDDVASVGGEHRNQCAICFDAFLDVLDEDLDDKNDGEATRRSSPDRYELLPCRHCFHRECARHWLSIQKSCPVCRKNVEGMKGYSFKVLQNKAS